VFILDNGFCEWNPRYELSTVQCPVDVKWFPFDRQECNVTFESWMLKDPYLDLVIDDWSVGIGDGDFLPPDDWIITGMFCQTTERRPIGPQ